MAEAFEESGAAFVHQLPSHNTRLLDSLYRQWIDNKYCDLLLLVQGEPILVHACVVSTFSPTVAEILLYRSSEKDVGTGILVEEENNCFTSSTQKLISSKNTVALSFSLEVVQCILSAFYTGVLQPKVEFLGELLEAAEWFCAADLVEAIKEHKSELISNSAELPTFQSTYDVGQVQHGSFEVNSGYTGVEEERLSLEFQESKYFIGRENSEAQKSPRGRTSTGSISENKISLCSMLCLNQNDSICHKETGGLLDNKTKSDQTHEIQKLNTFNNHSSNRNDKTCHETRIGSDKSTSKNVYMEPKVMVERLKVELKQKCPRKSGRPKGATKSALGKPKDIKENKRTSSVVSTLKSKERRERKRKKMPTNAGNTVQRDLIEVVEDNDPMKQELDFLVGSSTHVKCRQCNEKFTSIEVYYDHIKNHPEYTCKECGSQFLRQCNLTRHIRFVHNHASHLKCKLCGTEGDENENTKTPFTANSEVELRRHSLEVHGKRNPFTCPHEGCQFSSLKYSCLLYHQKIHGEEKAYQCDKCGQDFSQHAGLVSHQRACYRLKQYLCDLCGQSFNQPQSLTSHWRVVHLGERRYKCSVCPNSFSSHANLRRHMRIHDNSFPYPCPLCSQKYRHSNSLKAHMVSKHPGLPAEQYHIPMPKNKPNRKPRSKSTLSRGMLLPRPEKQARITSNSLEGDNTGQKSIASGVQSNNDPSAPPTGHPQGIFQPGGKQDHPSIPNQGVDPFRPSETEQPSLVISSSSDFDIGIDCQMGLAALQEKTTVAQNLGKNAAVTAGEQSHQEELPQDYSAFLGKQPALFGVHSNLTRDRGCEHAQSVTSTSTIASQHGDSQLLSSQTFSLSALSSNLPTSSTGYLYLGNSSISSLNHPLLGHHW